MTIDHAVPDADGWLNVADGVFHNARRRPRHPAIEHGGTVIDYAGLAARVDRLGAHLQRIGVAPGDVTGVALGDDVDHLTTLLALAWIGGVALPMDVRWTVEEKRRVAVHFEAARVLVPEGADAIDGVPTVVWDEHWRTAVATGPAGCVPLRRRDQPLVLSLSSGTTGIPKGPRVTHGHILSRLFIYSMSLGFVEADRFLSATPLYFGGGRNMAMAYLFMGATVVLHPPPYTPQGLAQAIVDTGATSLFLVPTMLRRLLELPPADGPRFPGVRLLVSSGASLYPDDRRAIAARLTPCFFNFYSSTEGGGISLLRPEHPDSVSMSVGRVVFGAEVQVVDAQHRPLPAGAVGAVRYRGGSVADAFHNDPQASALAFRDGWFYPGDLGRFDDDGFLYLVGRSKEMIIRGGINVYPSEIEQALAAHPAVAEVAVVGWPSRERGEEIAAFVVARTPVAGDALLAACRQVLAPYKVPRAVFVVDTLPRNSIGKVVKASLVDRLPRID